jgi:hypothetical protein
MVSFPQVEVLQRLLILVNSNQTPVGSTVNSLVIRCSLVNNNVSAQTDIIDAFAISGQFWAQFKF